MTFILQLCDKGTICTIFIHTGIKLPDDLLDASCNEAYQ